MFGFFKKLFGIGKTEEAVSKVDTAETVSINLGDSVVDVVVVAPKPKKVKAVKEKKVREKKVREKPAPKAKKVVEKPAPKKRGRPAKAK